jgi:mono/diheme cytochrome c family protein
MHTRFFTIATAAVWLAASVPGLAAEPTRPSNAADAPGFAQVRAIFAAKCFACHGNDAEDLQGEFDLRSREAAAKGGESGEPAIVPGEPDKSPLYRAVTWQDDALQMPPKENDRLSASEVDLVRRWISAGAKWDEAITRPVPDESWSSGPEGVRIATSGGLSLRLSGRISRSSGR